MATHKHIVFLGAGPWVLRCVQQLQANNHHCTVIANATQLQKIAGQQTVSEQLQHAGAQVKQVESSTQLGTHFTYEPQHPALVFSYGAPWILSGKTINSVFNNQVINLHGTHLPKQRGGTLFSWQILTGQKTGMCLAHRLTAGIDEGPVMAWEEFIYPAHCRKPADYITEYETRTLHFVLQLISNWPGWDKQQNIQQPEYLSTYWPRLLAPVNGWLNFAWTATELERFILAFDEPYGGARCRLNGNEVIIRDAYAQQMDGGSHPFQHGLVYRNNGRWINVAVQGGELLINQVLNNKGENIIADIAPGERLYSLPQDLTLAGRRVVKTKDGLKARD